MPTQIDPDVYNIDIPILPRLRTVKPAINDRDSANMDIPILFGLKCRIQTPLTLANSERGVLQVPPSTPIYWSDEMERECYENRQRENCKVDRDGDGWVVLDERGKLFGWVHLDEMTA